MVGVGRNLGRRCGLGPGTATAARGTGWRIATGSTRRAAQPAEAGGSRPGSLAVNRTVATIHNVDRSFPDSPFARRAGSDSSHPVCRNEVQEQFGKFGSPWARDGAGGRISECSGVAGGWLAVPSTRWHAGSESASTSECDWAAADHARADRRLARGRTAEFAVRARACESSTPAAGSVNQAGRKLRARQPTALASAGPSRPVTWVTARAGAANCSARR